MNRFLMGAAAAGAGLYWASKQPGGIKGTWSRAKQGIRDIRSGESPMEVGKRFISGRSGRTGEEIGSYGGFRSETSEEIHRPYAGVSGRTYEG